jgi:hypothetical protein
MKKLTWTTLVGVAVVAIALQGGINPAHANTRHLLR